MEPIISHYILFCKHLFGIFAVDLKSFFLYLSIIPYFLFFLATADYKAAFSTLMDIFNTYFSGSFTAR